MNDASSWKPFLTKFLRDKYFNGETKITDARVQPGAPDKIQYIESLKNQEQINEYERNIKKDLSRRFEDARIATVKKTTNWNF